MLFERTYSPRSYVLKNICYLLLKYTLYFLNLASRSRSRLLPVHPFFIYLVIYWPNYFLLDFSFSQWRRLDSENFYLSIDCRRGFHIYLNTAQFLKWIKCIFHTLLIFAYAQFNLHMETRKKNLHSAFMLPHWKFVQISFYEEKTDNTYKKNRLQIVS